MKNLFYILSVLLCVTACGQNDDEVFIDGIKLSETENTALLNLVDGVTCGILRTENVPNVARLMAEWVDTVKYEHRYVFYMLTSSSYVLTSSSDTDTVNYIEPISFKNRFAAVLPFAAYTIAVDEQTDKLIFIEDYEIEFTAPKKNENLAISFHIKSIKIVKSEKSK